jgi:hypothetical protein
MAGQTILDEAFPSTRIRIIHLIHLHNFTKSLLRMLSIRHAQTAVLEEQATLGFID